LRLDNSVFDLDVKPVVYGWQRVARAASSVAARLDNSVFDLDVKPVVYGWQRVARAASSVAAVASSTASGEVRFSP
jgi:hypothetical protein